MFKIVKRYYDRGIYTKENVAAFVQAGKLTGEQYEEIVGEVYAL